MRSKLGTGAQKQRGHLAWGSGRPPVRAEGAMTGGRATNLGRNGRTNAARNRNKTIERTKRSSLSRTRRCVMRRLPALASSAAAARDLLHAERSPILELASARREAHSGVLICPIGSRIAGGVKERSRKGEGPHADPWCRAEEEDAGSREDARERDVTVRARCERLRDCTQRRAPPPHVGSLTLGTRARLTVRL